MRLTTGFLLTAALLIPGAAQAQYGGPGSPYDPYGLRPGVGEIPGLPPNSGGRYVAPSRFQPWAGGIPGVPDGYEQIGPRGIPGLPGPLGRPNMPGGPSELDPFGRPNGVQFPPGVVAPYDPTARFRGAGGIVPPSPAIPDIRNLPQAPPMPMPPKFDFKNMDYKPDLKLPTPPASSPSWGCGSWTETLLAALGAFGAAGAAAGCRRKSSDDRK